MKEVSVFWFRRDLRIHDNTGLYYALNDRFPVVPVFIFDKIILDKLESKSDARVQFIHDQLSQLNQIMRSHQSRLWVYHDEPVKAFKELLKIFSVKAVYTNRDYEPYAKDRDESIRTLLKENGTEFYSFKDQVIFESGEILTAQETPYRMFTPYKNKWMEVFEKELAASIPSETLLNNLYQDKFKEIPSLKSIGFKASSIKIPPNKIEKNTIVHYDKTRDYPGIDGTSRLGIHLRHGTLSIRKATSAAWAFSTVWLNELIWREFYMMILSFFPEVTDQSFKPEYDRILWKNDEKEFKNWCLGKTGYPLVDAGMRELIETGYMHNRVRMITASFLTKHLLIDWRWGENYFAQHLLDYELASNNGGWQWAAGTGTDAQPYFRVFNPYTQAEKFDPELKYIKKWVKEYDTEDYTKPIVDHKYARNRAIEVYKQALGR